MNNVKAYLCINWPYHGFRYFFPRTIFSSSSRLVRYADKCMKNSKHDWTLSGTATSLQFFFNPLSSAKSFQFTNFLEAMFYQNYLTSDFHTNTGRFPFDEIFENFGWESIGTGSFPEKIFENLGQPFQCSRKVEI